MSPKNLHSPRLVIACALIMDRMRDSGDRASKPWLMARSGSRGFLRPYHSLFLCLLRMPIPTVLVEPYLSMHNKVDRPRGISSKGKDPSIRKAGHKKLVCRHATGYCGIARQRWSGGPRTSLGPTIEESANTDPRLCSSARGASTLLGLGPVGPTQRLSRPKHGIDAIIKPPSTQKE